MTISAYIHIPFCSQKCDFCDFAAFAGLSHLEDEYCRVVCREIIERLKGFNANIILKSLFYGGGTPGLIDTDNLAKMHELLHQYLTFDDGLEITLETTPQAITKDKAQRWLAMGINRLSIGIESFQDDELKAIGRDHNRQQAIAGLAGAIEAGFNNINCDLMYGLPTQTLATWQRSLQDFSALASRFEAIKHISAYALELTKQSPLLKRFPAGCPDFPPEEQFIEMYEALLEAMVRVGFIQYEISNFSKPGYQSVHNLNYWGNSDYLAFGVSAHRYVGGWRSSNWRSLYKYMQDPLGCETNEFIDQPKRLRETVMLGLRKMEGIDLLQFERDYGIDISAKFANQIEHLAAGGFIQVTDHKLKLSPKGVPVSNSIICEFLF